MLCRKSRITCNASENNWIAGVEYVWSFSFRDFAFLHKSFTIFVHVLHSSCMSIYFLDTFRTFLNNCCNFAAHFLPTSCTCFVHVCMLAGLAPFFHICCTVLAHFLHFFCTFLALASQSLELNPVSMHSQHFFVTFLQDVMFSIWYLGFAGFGVDTGMDAGLPLARKYAGTGAEPRSLFEIERV